jgi:hypothetical protein
MQFARLQMFSQSVLVAIETTVMSIFSLITVGEAAGKADDRNLAGR